MPLLLGAGCTRRHATGTFRSGLRVPCRWSGVLQCVSENSLVFCEEHNYCDAVGDVRNENSDMCFGRRPLPQQLQRVKAPRHVSQRLL